MSIPGLTNHEQASLAAQADRAAIASVKAEAPSSFRVGAAADILGKNVDAVASYNRTWANGLGLTAYLKAWYHDAAVIPADKHGAAIGVELEKKF